MEEPTLWALLLTQGLVLAVAGIVGAWAAGRVGTAPMVGAVIAGVVLGPTVMGQLAPGTYRMLFVGGHEVHQQIEQFKEEAEEARAALEATGVTPIAIEEHDAVVAEELERLEAELEQARGPHDQTLAIIAVLGLGFVMLSATRGVTRLGPWRPLLPAAAGIAVGSAALAALTAAVLVALLAWLGRFEAPALWIGGIAVGCAAAATPIPTAALQGRRGEPLDHRLLQITAWCITFILLAIIATLAAAPADAAPAERVTSALGVLMVIAVAFALGPIVDAATDRFVAATSDGSRTPPALTGFVLVVLLGIALMVVGYTFATVALAVFVVATALRRSHHACASIGGLGDRAAQGLFSPMLMALAGLHVHLLTDFDWLLALAVLIAFGDGKALGALLAGRGSSFSWPVAIKSGAALSSGSATPVAIALLLLLTGIIDGPAYTALVLAALVLAALALPSMRMVDNAFAEPE